MFLIIILLIILTPLILSIKLAATLCRQVHWIHALIPLLHASALGGFTWVIWKQPSNTGDATPGVAVAYLLGYLAIHCFFIAPTGFFAYLASSGIYTTGAFYLLLKTILVLLAVLSAIAVIVPARSDLKLRHEYRGALRQLNTSHENRMMIYFGYYSFDVPGNYFTEPKYASFKISELDISELPGEATRSRYFAKCKHLPVSLKTMKSTINGGTLETHLRVTREAYKKYSGTYVDDYPKIMVFYKNPRCALGMDAFAWSSRYDEEYLKKWHDTCADIVKGYRPAQKNTNVPPGSSFYLSKGVVDRTAMPGAPCGARVSFSGRDLSFRADMESSETPPLYEGFIQWVTHRVGYPWIVLLTNRYGRPSRTYGKGIGFLRYKTTVLDSVSGKEIIVRTIDRDDKDSLTCRWTGYDRKNSCGIYLFMESDFSDLEAAMEAWGIILKSFRRT